MKRLIKKIIRALLCFWCFCIFFIPKVKAVSGNPNLNGVEFYTAPAATFLDNSNEKLTGLSTTYNNTGKYFQSDITLNGASTGGGNLNITLLEPMQLGYTYALSVLVGTTEPLRVSTKRVCMSEGLSNNVYRWENHNSTTNWCVTPTWTDSMGGVNFNVENSSYPTTIKYTILYYIFTCNFSSRSVMVAFNTNNISISSSIVFGGYRLQLLSDNNTISQSDIRSAVQSSGLATASSVSQVQSSINQVQQELSGVQQEQQQTNEKLDDLNDNITSDDAPTIDLSDIDSPSSTPISDLVTLPASLLNSYLTAFSGTCSSYTLPLPFNHSVTLPCFTISDYVGSTVANIIDMAICLFMAYEIVLLFIRIFDDITTLSDTYTNWVKRGRY